MNDEFYAAFAAQGDRFIPSRSEMNMDLAHYALTKENKVDHDIASPTKVRPPATSSRHCTA